MHRQHDHHADQHEGQQFRRARRLPDGQPVQHHERKEAVGKAGEAEGEDADRPDEGQPVKPVARQRHPAQQPVEAEDQQPP